MFYIVRHGETEKNKAKTLQGRSDFPLNDRGREQAGELGAWFQRQGIRIDQVYSSPLSRAVETAGLIAGDVPVQTDDRLIEMDYGPYEGISLENPPAEIITFFSDFVHNPAPAGMEPLSSVTERMGDFLQDIRKLHDRNVLISVHAISMKGALEYLTKDAGGAYWSRYIPNCGLYAFEGIGEGEKAPWEIRYAENQEITPGV